MYAASIVWCFIGFDFSCLPGLLILKSVSPHGQLPAAALLKRTGLCSSTGDARLALAQGGAYRGEDRTRFTSRVIGRRDRLHADRRRQLDEAGQGEDQTLA